jgi:deoxyribonuclease IV
MKYVGAHVSISGGVDTAPGRGTEIGAKALGMFTKNQRQWKAPALTDETISAFKANLRESGIAPELVVVHDTYLINIGNPDPEKRQQSLNALINEAHRVEQLGLSLLNFHPGSGLKAITEEETLDLIADGMNTVLSESESAVLLIEGTAGQGAHVGYRFEHLAELISQSKDPSRVGVCLDTCHLFGAGYDLRSEETYESVMNDFGQIVGFPYLKAMHINDSKIDLGSRKDRHEKIGQGLLGIDAFGNLMKDDRLDGLPFVLETPDPASWKEEIETLYSLV